MIATNKIEHTKNALIEALTKSLGIVTKACDIVKVDRSTYYRYYNEDIDFKNKVDEIAEMALDFAETKLFEQIEGENITAIIFYLKTKGKKRGYIERQEIDADVTTKHVVINLGPGETDQQTKLSG